MQVRFVLSGYLLASLLMSACQSPLLAATPAVQSASSAAVSAAPVTVALTFTPMRPTAQPSATLPPATFTPQPSATVTPASLFSVDLS